MIGLLAFSLLCVAAFAAPPHEELILSELIPEGPHPAYQKDIEISPTAGSRIINGQNAFRNQFPYQISLEWGWVTLSHICGGSIITARTVVSAAHCTPPGGTYRVVAGILNRGESTTARQQRAVSNIINHPGYPGGNVVAPNDISLVIVASAFSFSTAVSPVSLPSSGASFSGTAVVSGWGRWNPNSNALPVTLQFATKNLITQNQCASALLSLLGSTGPLDNTMVCTSGAQRVTVCNGDSGGPLVQNGILVGVVSWGISPCGTLNAPSVFTRTASFINWINWNSV